MAANLGVAYTVQGKCPLAAQAFQGSVQCFSQFVEPGAVAMGVIYNNMGVLYAKVRARVRVRHGGNCPFAKAHPLVPLRRNKDLLHLAIECILGILMIKNLS